MKLQFHLSHCCFARSIIAIYSSIYAHTKIARAHFHPPRTPFSVPIEPLSLSCSSLKAGSVARLPSWSHLLLSSPSHSCHHCNVTLDSINQPPLLLQRLELHPRLVERNEIAFTLCIRVVSIPNIDCARLFLLRTDNYQSSHHVSTLKHQTKTTIRFY